MQCKTRHHLHLNRIGGCEVDSSQGHTHVLQLEDGFRLSNIPNSTVSEVAVLCNRDGERLDSAMVMMRGEGW